jgi:hypothetical protein
LELGCNELSRISAAQYDSRLQANLLSVGSRPGQHRVSFLRHVNGGLDRSLFFRNARE